MITVAAGANLLARAAMVAEERLGPETTVLLQMEVPPAEVALLAGRAKRHGSRVILNLAPAQPLAEETLRQLDMLVVNESEARALPLPPGLPKGARSPCRRSASRWSTPPAPATPSSAYSPRRSMPGSISPRRCGAPAPAPPSPAAPSAHSRACRTATRSTRRRSGSAAAGATDGLPPATPYERPYAVEVSAVMITLYSYPTLFGVADNNGYGLKVFAFMRLTSLPFTHKHIFDASAAPRGQLPYIVDDGETVGDSETIIAHLISKYRLTVDAALGARERDLSLL